MKKSPLSIFSFSTLQLSGKVPRTIRALFVMLLIALFAELGVRLLLPQKYTAGWDYWDRSSANKYLNYLDRLDQNKSCDLLVVGDSTAAYGFDPTTFADTFDQEIDCFNLATLGNFPLSFSPTIRDWILYQEPKPKHLLIIFNRGAFEKKNSLRNTEQAILDSAVMRRQQGKWIAADPIHLLRLWPSIDQLVDTLRGRKIGPTKAGLHPHPTSGQRHIKYPKASRALELDPDRINVLVSSLRLAQEKGIHPILVHAPVHNAERQRWNNPQVYPDQMQTVCDQMDIPFWDYSLAPYDEDMHDLVHLSPAGSKRFTLELAERYENWRASIGSPNK